MIWALTLVEGCMRMRKLGNGHSVIFRTLGRGQEHSHHSLQKRVRRHLYNGHLAVGNGRDVR